MTDIKNPDDLSDAVLFEAIGQTFAVIGMAVAKWSLGLFLLRLVKSRWHKIVIWFSMACLMGASVSTCFVFWLQCTPQSTFGTAASQGDIATSTQRRYPCYSAVSTSSPTSSQPANNQQFSASLSTSFSPCSLGSSSGACK